MDTIQRVRELANERNLTLSKLAELCNLPQSTIKNTARRKGQLSVETLEQICRGLGISWSEFFAKEDEQRVLIIGKIEFENLTIS